MNDFKSCASAIPPPGLYREKRRFQPAACIVCTSTCTSLMFFTVRDRILFVLVQPLVSTVQHGETVMDTARKSRRREELLKLLQTDPKYLDTLHQLRCLSPEAKSDSEAIEEILEIEFPDDRTPEQIQRRKEREREDFEKGKKLAMQMIRKVQDEQRKRRANDN